MKLRCVLCYVCEILNLRMIFYFFYYYSFGTVLHCHSFHPGEYGLSICSTRLKDDPTVYYVVGTALVNPEESESKQGRIILFSFTDGKLQQVSANANYYY